MKKLKIFPKMFIQIFSVLGIIIILVQILIRIYFGYQKQYFHMDEMYSYGLMNYNKLNIADNEDFLNKWHNTLLSDAN